MGKAVKEKQRIHLSIGSNIGDREEYLKSAIKLFDLFPETDVVATSDIYLCEPVGKGFKGYFLNMAACIETTLSLTDFHRGLLEIELILGKIKTPGSNDRTIDIDIIFAGKRTGKFRGLIIPHPRYSKRSFVLMPLLDLEATLREQQANDVHRYLDKLESRDKTLCLKYKKMVY